MQWDEIYKPLLAAGAVSTQRDLSRMAGGADSLVSTSISRSRPPSIESLVRIVVGLEDLEKDFNTALMSGNANQITEENKKIGRMAYHMRGYILEDIRRQCRETKPEGGEE